MDSALCAGQPPRKVSIFNGPRIGRALWILCIVCVTLGVFWLPWQLPSTTPANGESYVLGFNNRLAVLALVVGIAAATAARLTSRTPSPAVTWLVKSPDWFPRRDEAWVEYLILISMTFIWTRVLWSWCTSLVDPAYGDSRVMIYAMDLMAIGRVPYRDFIFNYGAAHVYLPFLLSWGTGGAISFEYAYYVVLMLFIVVGFVSIFWFIRSLTLPQRWRPIALLLALLSWALFHTCTAHVAARFLCVPVGLVALHAVRGKLASLAPHGAVLGAAATSFMYVLYCLLMSPEMGVAAFLAVGGYACGVAVLQRSRITAAAYGVGAALAIAGIVHFFPNYFVTVVAFAGGFGNLPVYPNLANVMVVISATVVFSGWFASAVQNPTDSRSPLAVGLALGGGVLLVGCFGRAAPEHVFFNAMTPLLSMFAVVARCGPLPRKLWLAVYIIVEIVLLQLSHWWTHSGTFTTAIQLRRMYDENPQVVAAWREQWQRRLETHPARRTLHWAAVLPFPAELQALERNGMIMQTGGAEWNLWLARYLLLQEPAPRDFFVPAILSACTPPQLQKRLEDLTAARYLLVPESDISGTESPVSPKAYEDFVDRWLGVTMFYPVRSKVRFTPYFPDTVQAKELLKYFEPVGTFRFLGFMPFVLMERKNAGSH
jgi:hypothetical protein